MADGRIAGRRGAPASRRRDPEGGKATASAAKGPMAEGSALSLLHSQFEELGLSPSEARVLAALLQVGVATAPELSRLSGVPRTNTYPVVESLSRRNLAIRNPGKGAVLWAAPNRADVLPSLEADLLVRQEERLAQHRARAALATKTMSSLLTTEPRGTISYVSILRGPADTKRIYDQMVSEAKELLVCNRPPYTHDRRFPNPVVIENMARGLRARALYQADHWHDPGAEQFRKALDAYHAAGVEWRLAAELPIKMAVADRRKAIVSLNDPSQPDGDLEVTVLVEHPDYAAVHATIFENLWADALTGGQVVDEPGSESMAAGEDLAG